VVADALSYIHINNSSLVHAAGSFGYSIVGTWGSELDINECSVKGGDPGSGTAINASLNGLVSIITCKITDWNNGVLSSANGMAYFDTLGVNNYVHDCHNVGVVANNHGIVAGTATNTYGVLPSGGADANGGNESNEAASYSWVD
jgi:hypothetical protein